MDELKKITSKDIEEIARDYFPASTAIVFHGKEIAVQRMLPYKRVCALIEAIVKSCFDSESGEYMPEVRDFATRLAVASAYTDLELPEDTDEQYAMLYSTDMMQKIYEAIDHGQLDMLRTSVQRRCDIINDANRTAIEKELYEAVGMISTLADNIGKIFKDVSSEEVAEMVNNLMTHGVDEEKLVDEVVRKQNELREKADGKIVPFPAAEENDGE